MIFGSVNVNIIIIKIRIKKIMNMIMMIIKKSKKVKKMMKIIKIFFIINQKNIIILI
jgi:hypothetical protein